MTPDFLDTMLSTYHSWKKTGRVTLNGEDVALDVQPSGDPSPDEYVQFVRAYLRKNPIVSTSFTTGLTLFLADRQQLPFANNTAAQLQGNDYNAKLDNNYGFC